MCLSKNILYEYIVVFLPYLGQTPLCKRLHVIA